MNMTKLRWSLRREKGFLPERGFAILTSGGCLGSTYGEPGFNMTRTFRIVLFKWDWRLNLSWKKL